MERAIQVLQRLKGPVVPLNICFTGDNEIDTSAMCRYVNWLCEQQVPVLLLTYGSSEFSAHSDEEIWRLTAELAEAIGGRSLFIASTGLWHPEACRRFLRHADQAGVDAVKVQINPLNLYTPDADLKRQVIQSYYDRILDAAPIPLLLWVDGLASHPIEAITELAKHPQVVGVKNDGDQFYFYYDLIRATAEEDFAVISGGQMRNFMFGYPLGSPAYLCTIAPFRPDIALGLYDLLAARRFDEAWKTVIRYEEPWLKTAEAMDWLASIKTAIYLHGLFPNDRVHPPYRSHAHEQRETIRQCLERVFDSIRSVDL